MDEGGLLWGAHPEHVLRPVEAGLREPGRVVWRARGGVDDVRALVAEHARVVPNLGPEPVDVLRGPVVEVLVGREGEALGGVYALEEADDARGGGRRWGVECHGGLAMRAVRGNLMVR